MNSRHQKDYKNITSLFIMNKYGCISCKTMYKHKKCIDSMCRKCCKNKKCIPHTKIPDKTYLYKTNNCIDEVNRIIINNFQLPDDISQHILSFVDLRNLCKHCNSYIDTKNQPYKCENCQCKLCFKCRTIKYMKCWDEDCIHKDCQQTKKKLLCNWCCDVECRLCFRKCNIQEEYDNFFKCYYCKNIYCDNCETANVREFEGEGNKKICDDCCYDSEYEYEYVETSNEEDNMDDEES